MKILIVRVSAIGDVIHTLPAVFLIKKYCPHAQISWVVQKKAASLIVDQPFLENVFVINDKFLNTKNILHTLKTIKKMRQTSWDAIIDFQGIHKTSALIMFLNGKKFGFAVPHARTSMSTWFTHIRTNPEYKNIIQKNLSLASNVLEDLCNIKQCPTIDILKKEFYLNFKPQNKDLVDNWLQKNNISNFVLICPNTTWETKHWPDENWIEFAKLFKQQYQDRELLLVGRDFGAAAKNIAFTLEKHGIAIKYVPPFNLNATAYLISKANLVIAPDTGLLHMADFLNIRTIGIFGPTNNKVVGPFLNIDNIKNAIQVYKPDQWNLKKTTKAQNNMYKLKSETLLEKTKELLK
ncbi:MAG: Lipopolysaccharide heptosyltransferase I [candidate division TM6 bacterium GW2011_GWF2_37_49]|nr:MAG: Lipopolysaccharide heptosyltransferase I [candidate division TM6 bacterium GW2011_GWF2_37_49]